MTVALRVAVLVSGRGSNLGALIDAARAGMLPIDIVLAASDRLDAPALARAAAAGIPTFAIERAGFADRRAYDDALFAGVAAHAPDLVVLAGFMRVLGRAVVRAWQGRMINIHPSLLPLHRGLDTHARALAAGDAVHGASVHFVTAELDGGPVIAQAGMALDPGDDAEAVAARLLPLEHRLLVATVGLLATRRIALAGDTVLFDGSALAAPLRLREDGSLAPTA
jgi:phosphoribosylglycinamide formyltransferase-1